MLYILIFSLGFTIGLIVAEVRGGNKSEFPKSNGLTYAANRMENDR